MRPGHPRERAVGMAWYVSDADGTGGRLRDRPVDFRVREVEAVDAEPVDADPGGYPHVVVRATLDGWDTNDFAAALSDALGISRERVSWAGTKDKHAVTTQLFSVRKVDPDELRAVDLSGADLTVVGRTGRPVLFGDLAGNEFEVTVRDPDRPKAAEDVAAELAASADSGGDPAAVGDPEAGGTRGSGGTDTEDGSVRVAVPNYFGQQRFGSRRPVTHEVGLAVARGDWEGAVMAYLGNPHEAEPEATREARAHVEETRDWRAAAGRFPGGLRYERSMCHALAESDDPADPDPADYRRALETVPSNLQRLFVHAAQSYAFNRILSERLERGLPLGRPVEGDVVCFADRSAPEGFPLPDTDRVQRVTGSRVDSVRRHCERGRAFVTAPLVGTGTDLADGEPGEIERSVLDDLDLEPADFDLPGEFGSSGDRRATLVATDLRIDRDPLAFSFRLPRGSYATVLLREFLKADPAAMG
ncbi:tRNA pseudouridine(13) synthase TruD [Halobacteriales archaeon QS_8_69_26]|nr:MAG: tRNA pseudouridine(13) synthase TruD [Halobacteriales archaeon QS_8_69_26]